MNSLNARAHRLPALLVMATLGVLFRGTAMGADEATPSVAAAPASPAVPAARASSLAGGKHVAEVVCWACHVVAADQEFPPLLKSPAPSFAEIAGRPGTTLKSLVAYIRTTHWERGSPGRQMPDPMLTGAQTQAVSRYILSLRQP